MMEVVVTTRAITRAKLQLNIITNKPTPNFFTGQMPFLLPKCVSVKASKGIYYSQHMACKYKLLASIYNIMHCPNIVVAANNKSQKRIFHYSHDIP